MFLPLGAGKRFSPAASARRQGPGFADDYKRFENDAFLKSGVGSGQLTVSPALYIIIIIMYINLQYNYVMLSNAWPGLQCAGPALPYSEPGKAGSVLGRQQGQRL